MINIIDLELFHYAKQNLSDRRGAHAFDHIERVLQTATIIAETEKANIKIVQAMALLHDYVRDEVAEEQNASKSAVLAEEILQKFNYTSWEIENISEGIKTHSISSDKDLIPQSIESKILFDADKLDAVGEIGIARWFMHTSKQGLTIKQASGLYIKTINGLMKKMNGKLFTEKGTELIQKDLNKTIEFFEKLLKKFND